jgi:hypothetical protein
MSVRPPQDITPARFFEEWLPAQVAQAARRPTRQLRVRSILEGDEGGVWDLVIGPDVFDVTRAGNGGEPDVTMRQSVRDWRAFLLGEPGGVDLVPARDSSGGSSGMLMLDRTAEQVLASVKGEVRFEVTNFNGRTWSLDVKLGSHAPKASPDTTISVEADVYAAMLARTLPVPQAYFQGKIRITGDANLAMQLGMAMMPRFS